MKKSIFYILPFAALVGCTSNDLVPQNDGEQEEIVLNSTFDIATVDVNTNTRTIVDPLYATNNDLAVAFARIDQDATTGSYPAAYSTNGTGEPLTATRAKGANFQKITFTTPQYYLNHVTNFKTKLVGWYPADSKATYDAGGVVKFDISDGGVDVMLTNEVEGDKTTAANKFGASGKEFTFSHLLTQIKVSAYAVSADAKTAWGKIKSIKVKSLKPTCKVTLPSTVAFEGTAADVKLQYLSKSTSDGSETAITYPLELGVAVTTPAAAKNDVACGYLMFEPTSGSSVTLAVETEKGATKDVTVTLASSAKFDKSKAYAVTLKFDVSTIEPTAKISEWTPVPVPDVEM